MEQAADLAVRFLGVGGASQRGIGHASAVVEITGKTLLIDCGPGTTQKFTALYNKLPDAVFITHCHLDHVGDFENLFIQCLFTHGGTHRPKVFVPMSIIPLLHMRVASYPSPLAEGGTNFWDAFHLIPVHESFIFAGAEFSVNAVRHHAPNTAFGLGVNDSFFYTGDTRPIPEVLNQLSPETIIFHDCATRGNPSHSGIEDVLREYSDELLKNMYFYHYTTEDDVQDFRQHNMKVVLPNDHFRLTSPSTITHPSVSV